jgi:prephenate dehydrogenase
VANPASASTEKPLVGTLVVVGLGLIGGSFAMAARQRGLCQQVLGVALDKSTCEQAEALGVVDQAFVDWQPLARSLVAGDMVFIAVPTLSTRAVLAFIHEHVDAAVSITDGASVKGSVLRDALAVYGFEPPQLVLGHPIAGSEKSGVTAANPQLYSQHRVILTPSSHTGVAHLQQVRALWQGLGAEVLELSVAEHDDILAATSHLPHAIAFSLVDTLAHDSKNEAIFRYAAGGLRDFTRIASSDATMWRDILLANKDSVLSALDLFSANLACLREAVAQADADALQGIFSRAKAARDHFTQRLACQAAGTPLPPSERWIIAPGIKAAEAVFLPADTPFFLHLLVAALLADKPLVLQNCPLTACHIAWLDVLQGMGAQLELRVSHTLGGVEWADLAVTPGPLEAVNLSAQQLQALGENLGPLWVVCLSARGTSLWQGAAALATQSQLDRLQAALNTLGAVRITQGSNWLIEPSRLCGGSLAVQGDTDLALTLAICGPLLKGNLTLMQINPQDSQSTQAAILAKRLGLLLNSFT